LTRAIDTLFKKNTVSLQDLFGVTLTFYPTGAASAVEGIKGFLGTEAEQVVGAYDTTTTGYIDTIQVFLSDIGSNRTGYFLHNSVDRYDIVTVLNIDENQITFSVKKR